MSGQRYSVTIDVGANISSAKSAAQQLKGIFDNIGLGAGQSSKISNMFSELDKALDEVQRKSATALTSMSEVKGLDKAKDKVTSLINAINSEFTKMGKMGNVDLAKNFGDLTRKINDATKAIRNYNTTISGISRGHAAAKSSASALSQQLAEQTKYYEQLKQIRKEFGKGQKDEDILKALNQKQITAKGLDTRRRNELQAFYDAHGGKESVLTQKGTIRQEWAKNNAQDAQALEKLIQKSNQASQAFTQASEKYQNFSNALSNFKGSKAFEELKSNAAEATQALQKFDSGVLNAEAFNKLKAALEQAFGPEITAGIQNSATAVDEFKQRIEQVSAKKLEEFRKKVPEIDTLLKQLGLSGEEVGKKITDGMSSFSAMREADADIEHLTYRLKYFFSLAGGFNLMRRAIRSAVTTTKELDAAMTQTAVVSTYTVSDMWKTLPKYSKEASKLGTAIKDVYNAQTLYVQQGLDMNTAMDIGVETMKMARVAGIGAEEATNSMTAALRGFNMAIDEKSAQRINDVYSKLAQNTASNTQEISTAMTKTAALANSANMSFENTAAFLATIIESTREGAETAGTALKTVIARFTEVKQLYTKNQLMGTDEEGQEIDVNKISKALRTAGINMNEFFTGAKGLDQIFKELGSKWNNLSTVQQRYIATQAAGSRQQSRFLALMQNYERTVELTEMAYNSAGSGQEQFEKTLESLEAKMAQLKNSWDTLLMGLANSDAIKGIVDFGTSVLDIINKIISAISGNSGLTKALATLSLGMGVFKIGRGAFGKDSLLSSLLGGKEISTRVSRTLVGGIVTSLRKSETTRELGNTLGGTITNSFKKNFRFWGKGTEIEGQYFSKDQLDNIKKEATEYQKERKSIQEDINKKQQSFDEAQANASQRALTEEEVKALQAKEKALEDAKERQEALDKKYYETQQRNGLNQQQAAAAAENPNGIPEATTNYKAIANAALLAGTAITAAGAAMKNSGKFANELTDSVTALGTGLITTAMAAKLLQSIGTAIKGLSFLSGNIGMGIAAGLGAIVAIVGVVDALTESAEEKQKRINETISKNQTHIKDLENGYKQVDDSLGSIIEKQDNLNKLTEGTLAWKDAVKELNTEIQALVQNFPEFLEAVEIGDNGQWSIDLDAVREIQSQKKEEINNSKKFDLALQFTKQLEDLSKINDTLYSWDLDTFSGNTTLRNLDEKLQGINYDAISIESINSLIRKSSKSFLKDIVEDKDFSWIREIFGEEGLQELINMEAVAPELLTYLSQGLQQYKQQSIKSKEINNSIKSGLTSYLIDQLDESLPQDVYGGAFRKFIYSQAIQMAELMVSDLVNSQGNEYEPKHKLDDYTDLYYKYQGYKQIGGEWQDLEGNKAKKVEPAELAQFAQIVDLFDEVDGIIDYFINNPNDFTLGKLRESDYQAKIKGKVDALDEKIAEYYLEQFEEWNKLLKKIGLNSTDYFASMPMNIVNQALPLIKDIKNTYGKQSAQGAGAVLDDIYRSIRDSKKGFDETIFQAITSDLETGVINTEEQLIERLKQFGIDFNKSHTTKRKPIEYTQFIKLFKKKDTFQSLIDSFSERYSFLDSIRGGKTSYTEEEKKLLLTSGKFKKSDFKRQGDFWEVIDQGSDTIANTYANSLSELYENSVKDISTALEKKKDFNSIKEDVTKGVYKSDKKLNKALGDSIQEKINSFLAQDFSSLTEKDIQAILQYAFGYNEIYNPESGKIVSTNIDKDVLTNTIIPWFFDDNYTELIEQRTALEQLSNTLSNAEGKMSSDTYSKLSSYINQIRNTRGNKRGNQLLSSLLDWNEKGYFNDLVDTEDFDKFPEFLDAIGKLDWSNINNVKDFDKALKDQKIVLDNSTGHLEELFNTFKEIYKLSKIITADEIKQLAQYGLQLKNEIKNKTDASYTKEQRDYLVNAQKELADQFVYNAETGGYTYIGKKEALEKVAQQAAVTTGYDRLEAQKVLSEPKNEGTDAYKQALKTLFGVEDLEGLSEERKTEIQEEIKGFQEDATFIAQEHEAATEVLKYAGLNNDQVRGLGASENIQKAAAIQDAAGQGFSVEDLQRYAQELMNIEGMTEGMAYAIAYDSMLMNKGVDELRSNFSSLKETIEGIERDEDGSLKLTTPQQLQSLASLNKIIQNITGTTEDFSNQFLTAENTLKLLQRILDGDTSALGDFRKEAAKDLLPKDLSNAPKEFRALQSAIDNLDLENVNIGDKIDLGIEGAIDNLLDMGAIGIEQAQAIYEALGFEPPEFEPVIDYEVNTPDMEVETEEETGEMTASLHGTGELAGVDGTATGTITGSYPVLKANDGGTKGHRNRNSHATAKAGGGGINSTPKGGGGGGGGKEFKNDFDKYYNQVEDINELIRIRNLLESDYNQLLKAEGSSGADIYENLKKQLSLLEERRKLTADLADKRKQQLFETMQDEEYKDVAKYATWNDEDLTIEIDWEAINKVKDSEEGNLIKEYVKKLEDFQSKYDEQIQALEEIEDAVQEIKERGKEEYKSLEDRVRDALIKQIQDKIDELQDVNEAINDTNQKLFDSISETLELQRQDRDNAKTEEELTDKEKRLAYLQQDSSNANQVEIAKLQEELADARESYTDTLIDQKISELQRQNDEAQEQRAQQIELMQHSLDWQEKNGEFWNQVYDYIQKGTDATGDLLTESQLTGLLQAGEGYAGLSQESQMNWLADLQKDVKSAVSYLAMTRQLEDIGTKEGTKVTFTNGNDQVLTGTVDKNGNVVVKNDDGSTTTYKNVFQDYSGAYQTFETNGEYKAAQKPITSSPQLQKSTTSSPQSQEPSSEELDGNGWYKDENYHWHKTKKGNVIDKNSHSWNYATKGWKTCSICGYYKKLQSGGGGCFVGGTKIIMANYIEKNIEDIKVGDWVFAYDEILRIFEPKKVTKSYIHYNTPSIMELMLSNGIVIKMTPGHPILTTTGWKSMDIENSLYEHGVIAKLLNIGDEIIGYGKNVFVKEIIIKDNTDHINVYNIEVEDLHTFVASKIVVHNMKALEHFASGGLATRTGPAWLDGTRSHPELVLNSRDTQNFIELKDTLADMRKNGSLSLAGGDSYYEIVVNVDQMSSDYDVDKAIDRIKARLAQDGAYRNVNTLSRLR